MSDKAQHIGHSIAKGATWMVFTRLAIRGVGVISTVILARLLVPADFGLVAMAGLIVGAVEAVSQFSFDLVLIQKQQVDRRLYDTAWTLSLIRGLVAALILVALAAPAAVLFEEPRLELVVYFLAIVALVTDAANIGVVDFRKELRFHKEFQFVVSEKLAAFLITVPLAFLWRDYWALVAGIVLGKVWRFAASYVMHPYRPRLCLYGWNKIFDFSKWLLIFNVLVYARLRSDTLVIGKMLGVASVGLYSLAFEISNMVTSELMSPIRRALFPGYAKIAHDRNALGDVFIETTALTMLIGAPMALGLGLVADPLVKVALGEKWIDCIPLVQVLVVSGLFGLLSSAGGPIMLAVGKPKYLTLVAIIATSLLIPSLIYGVSTRGVLGAAIAVAAVQFVSVSVEFTIVLRILGLRPWRLLAVSYRSGLALAVMAIAVHSVIQYWPDTGDFVSSAMLLATSVTVGAVAYVGAAYTLWRLWGRKGGPERHIVAFVAARLPS